MLKAGLHTECTFIQVPGIDHTAINYIPGCFHVFCTNCLKSHFLNAAMSNSKFTCPLIECRVDVDHHFIATFFGQSTEAEFHLLTKLKLDNHFFVKCFNCQRKQEIDKSVTFAKCKECGAEICKFCGKAQHTEIKCSEISEELSNYNNQDSSNIHRIYLCEQNSKSPELSRYYYHALSLYEWQIVHDNKDFMKKVNPTIADDCEFLLDKVEYVNNIMLLSNYERARAMLNEKNGIDPDEIYVYHGTKNDNVHSICRDGFRVGGVDISSSHGAVYGLGIYTASDPVVSMSYTVGSRNIIVCRALIGNCSAEPIMNDDNLRISKFDYYVASKIPGLNPDSLYYIFFKREFLLPIYVINFK